MLELSLILFAGAILILPSDWRQGLFGGCDSGNSPPWTDGFRGARAGASACRARASLFELQANGRKAGHPVIELAVSLLAVPVFWAFAQWRWGLLLCLATAILQDPLRKLTPDQPVLFVGFVGVVFGAACLGPGLGAIPLRSEPDV